jgi:integrase
VVIDRGRGYVYVRFKRQGLVRKELIGRTTDVDVIEKANVRARHLRSSRRSTDSMFEPRWQRLLVEDAADLFMRFHGAPREARKNAGQFARYVRLIKHAWSGRYVDTLIGDDMRNYRLWRKTTGGVAESTINREQTAIITMFNKLAEWRRSGRIPKNLVLPEQNPGKGVKKVNEDRFIRNRLMTDGEYHSLWSVADERLRRILLAVMNLPLRLADLKGLRKTQIDHRFAQFRGVQAKTGKEFALPINAQLWELVRSAAGDLILDFTGFAKRWKSALRLAGLHPKGERPLIQFRDLRRTAATTLHESGVSLRTISAMLGHQSMTTTIRYLGLKDENLKMAGDVLAARYSAPVENGRGRVESVPKSVPTPVENTSDKTTDSMRNNNDFGGVAQLVRAAAS